MTEKKIIYATVGTANAEQSRVTLSPAQRIAAGQLAEAIEIEGREALKTIKHLLDAIHRLAADDVTIKGLADHAGEIVNLALNDLDVVREQLEAQEVVS